jgi:hypothetical protein
MKLPRGLSGAELAKKLAGLGYEITRQNRQANGFADALAG